MKVKVCTVATSNKEGLLDLKNSCAKNNIDLEVLGAGQYWRGFGMKIFLVRDYLEKINREYTHVLFIDAYDVLFLGNNFEEKYKELWNDKIVFSTEKACWPKASLANEYPDINSDWKYLNSGCYIAPIDKYLELIKTHRLTYTTDDQLYFTEIYLKDKEIILDTNCELFQSIAFEAIDDFEYNQNTNFKFINLKTRTNPTIIHGNGKTDMSKIKLL